LTFSFDDGAYVAYPAGGWCSLVAGSTHTVRAKNSDGCISGPTSITLAAQPPTPILVITNPVAVCSPLTVDLTAPAVTAGSTLYGATLNYYTNSEGTITLANPNAVTAGTYYIKALTSAGCSAIKSVVVMIEVCGGPVCTYTQGAYGNSGGKYCDGTEGGISTTKLIAQAIGNAGGSITVGKTGHSVIMNLADVSCVIDVMPGGGKARELDAGNYNICALPNTYLKNGRINNVLLSQTIAMALNINITSPSDLGSLLLQAGTLATAKPEGGCGSSIAKARVCAHYEGDVLIPTANEYTYRTFSAAVINAITADVNGDKTIAGLLDLANRALANADGIKNSEGGASLSDIAGAVAAINEVFDECAIFIGWDVQKCPPVVAPLTLLSTTAKTAETAGFIAYPVPVDGQLSVQCTFGYTSDVKIEVFDSKNQLVYTKTQAQCSNGTIITLDYNFNSEQQQIFYIKLTTSNGSTTHDVISAAK
jgi:hypothetical protein